MVTPAYILGALDTLVKAGELSPDYALGVASVLEKQAGLFWDSTASDYNNAYNSWKAQNPGKQMTPDAALAIADKSRNWWESMKPKAGWGNYIKNRFNKWTRWWPTDKMTGEMYDRQLKDMENRETYNRLKKRNIGLHGDFAGALQDAHMRDASFRLEDARRTMSPAARQAAGLTDDYADTYRTAAGDQAVVGKAYKPQFHKAPNAGPQKAPYGQNLPSSYGANKHLFYNTKYVNPLVQK